MAPKTNPMLQNCLHKYCSLERGNFKIECNTVYIAIYIYSGFPYLIFFES